MAEHHHGKVANAPDAAAHAKALQLHAAPATAPNPVVTVSSHCCVREFWAVVETNGTLVRGRNVNQVTKLAQGIYEVIFTEDISAGVFLATIGRPGIATEPTGEICLALRCCPINAADNNKGIWVETHDSAGGYSDRAFHLLVLTDS
jgi:hypothetical protein